MIQSRLRLHLGFPLSYLDHAHRCDQCKRNQTCTTVLQNPAWRCTSQIRFERYCHICAFASNLSFTYTEEIKLIPRSSEYLAKSVLLEICLSEYSRYHHQKNFCDSWKINIEDIIDSNFKTILCIRLPPIQKAFRESFQENSIATVNRRLEFDKF